MFRRIIALVVLAWLLGFAWFSMALPQPADEERTDAVIVLTGAEGRIPRGLEVLEKGWAKRMLVSGVAREVHGRAAAGAAHLLHGGPQALDLRPERPQPADRFAAHNRPCRSSRSRCCRDRENVSV